jgi:hypothetical protein
MVNIVSLRILGSASLIVALRASEGAHGLLLKRVQLESPSGHKYPEGCDPAALDEWSEFFKLYEPQRGGVGELSLRREVKSSPDPMKDLLAVFCSSENTPGGTPRGEERRGLYPDLTKFISGFVSHPLSQQFKKAKPSARKFLTRLLHVKGPAWNDRARMSRLVDVLLKEHLGALNRVGEPTGHGAVEPWTDDDLKALHAFYINDTPSVPTGPDTPSVATIYMRAPVLQFVAHACVHQYVRERMTKDGVTPGEVQQKKWLIGQLGESSPETEYPMEHPRLATWSKNLESYLEPTSQWSPRDDVDAVWMADLLRTYPVAFGALSLEIRIDMDGWGWKLKGKWSEWTKCLGALLEEYVKNFNPDTVNPLFDSITNSTTWASKICLQRTG